MTDFTPDPVSDYVRVGQNVNKFQPVDIIPFTPAISKSDRQFGEITRYFVRFVTHKTSADIIEVDKTTYNALKKNSFYVTTQVRWKISGPLDDQNGLPNVNTPIRLVTGVVTANKLSVQLSDEELSGLSEYITDYKRFWQF